MEKINIVHFSTEKLHKLNTQKAERFGLGVMKQPNNPSYASFIIRNPNAFFKLIVIRGNAYYKEIVYLLPFNYLSDWILSHSDGMLMVSDRHVVILSLAEK